MGEIILNMEFANAIPADILPPGHPICVSHYDDFTDVSAFDDVVNGHAEYDGDGLVTFAVDGHYQFNRLVAPKIVGAPSIVTFTGVGGQRVMLVDPVRIGDPNFFADPMTPREAEQLFPDPMDEILALAATVE